MFQSASLILSKKICIMDPKISTTPFCKAKNLSSIFHFFPVPSVFTNSHNWYFWTRRLIFLFSSSWRLLHLHKISRIKKFRRRISERLVFNKIRFWQDFKLCWMVRSVSLSPSSPLLSLSVSLSLSLGCIELSFASVETTQNNFFLFLAFDQIR